MSNPAQKHEQLLRAHGFHLIRSGRHLVYQNPEQKVYVVASTPSDHRAAANALSVLKRVIVSPPVPIVLAISEFERQEAARVIEPKQRQQRIKPGMGSGKQKHSRGTGYKYVEKILTAEELARNEQLRQQAITNKLRREERAKQRRADKLSRRHLAEQARENERQKFEETYRPFLNEVQQLVQNNEREFLQLCDAVIANRAWRATLFYEFATDKELREAEKWAHDIFVASLEHAKQEGPIPIQLMDEFIEDDRQQFAKYKSLSEQRVARIMRIVERQLSVSNSIVQLIRVLQEKEEENNSARWDVGTGCRMVGFDLFAPIEDHLRDDSVFDIVVNKTDLIVLKEIGEDTVEVVADFTNPAREEPEVAPELTAA